LQRGIRGPIGKILALAFAIFSVIACFGIGNMTQANAIASNVESSWTIHLWVTGLILTVMGLIVKMSVFGFGIRRCPVVLWCCSGGCFGILGRCRAGVRFCRGWLQRG